MRYLINVGLLTVCGTLCHAQKEPQIFRASAFDIGKSQFLMPAVAPGQVIEFAVRLPASMVEALKLNFIRGETPVEAAPWPLKLAEWSGKVRYRETGAEVRTWDMPVGGVRYVYFPGLGETALVTVQFPWEANRPPLGLDVGDYGASFSLSAAGQETAPVTARVVGSAPLLSGLRREGGPEGPARPGDRLTILATGLGRTSPPTPAGTAPRSPVPLEPFVFGGFNYGPRCCQVYFDFDNPSMPLGYGRVPVPAEEVTLKPGEVGVYEIRVTMPPVPGSVSSCTGWNPGSGSGSGNTRVTVVGDGRSDAPAQMFFCTAPDPL